MYGIAEALGLAHLENEEELYQEVQRQLSEHPKIDTSGEMNAFYGKHHTAETKKILSDLAKLRYKSENPPLSGRKHTPEERAAQSALAKLRVGKLANHYGKLHCEEAKTKISQSKKGRHYFTDGSKEIMRFECPEGFVPGRSPEAIARMRKFDKSNFSRAPKGTRWWNDGNVSVRRTESPGPEFVLGRKPRGL